MHIDFESQVPIYVQIAEMIKNDIIKGIFEEGSQVPSTTEISVNFKINPATVAKGYNLLVEEGIIYKKRGVGMFVCKDAKATLIEIRREDFYNNYIKALLVEAEKLGFSKSEVMDMMKGEKR